MKMKFIFSGLLFLGLLSGQVELYAQSGPETVISPEDKFQNAFYEALKQKGIENYDKAILELEKCLALQPNNPAVYNELGRNYLSQKSYEKARVNFDKATQLDPKNKWYWMGLYDVFYQTKEYEQSIIVVRKLIEFDAKFKDDLVSLYMYTQQFDKALELINELEKTAEKSKTREMYKLQILSDAKFKGSEKNSLLEMLQKNPKEESNYIALIYLYSDSNQEEKAYEIAQLLEKNLPESDWAQVSLFKFHLNNNEPQKAIKSMNQVFGSNKVDNKIKHRILNEFLIFVTKNPQYDADLEKAIGYFENDKEVQVSKEIGKFYLNKKDFSKAIKYLEKDLQEDSGDMEATRLLLQAYADSNNFEKLGKTAEGLIDLYPLQPELYYYAGLANNQLKKFSKAKDLLESGIDYVVDQKQLEINFNIQLGEAYSGLGNTAKKELFFQKADKLLKER
ncbi:tetratricopeptide repeat protein [Flavobacterium kingsejongi]|uniref:Cytochrome C biosynthesis protein n=1 Tax=Flavobacterium kingsejongi TaxID=1678728 RepID=A0A2S1LLM5_9FLAO|nr:tetratricopeptide repeat protein [Flavobacterium kingsejongi]AWG24598.1 cytochrome C biosynthesis protein [Flavobacterium kingsejongi]